MALQEYPGVATLPIVSDRAIIARAWGCELSELMQLIYVSLGFYPPHPGDVPHEYTPAGFTWRGRKASLMCYFSLSRQVAVLAPRHGRRLVHGFQDLIGDGTGGIGNAQFLRAAISHGQQPADTPRHGVLGHWWISEPAEFF